MYQKLSALLMTSFFIIGCDTLEEADVNQLDLASGDYECISMTTSMGIIELAIDKVKAPDTVTNFLSYTNDSFYDGTIFHRVIDGFMIQGGGFDEIYNQKTTDTAIANEANNGLLNIRGAIAMARTADPHSATSQFFINTVDNAILNFTSETTNGWGYAVFGQVVTGIDIVDSISGVSTGSTGPFSQDVPLQNIVIEAVEVIACSGVTQ